MNDSLFSDNAMRVARAALDGLSMKQQVVSRNLANVDTPGYQAQTIDFEDTLKRLIGNDGSLPMVVTDASHRIPASQSLEFSASLRPGGTFRADQNNVDIDVEMIDMSETGIQYQAVSQAVSQKLLLLKNLAR